MQDDAYHISLISLRKSQAGLGGLDNDGVIDLC